MNVLILILGLGIVCIGVLSFRNSRRGLSNGPALSAPGSEELFRLPADSQATFILCAFSMLGKLAASDGQISAEELKAVRWYADKRMRLNKRQRALALKVFSEAGDSPLELRDYAERFNQTFPERVNLADSLVEILIELSAADGFLAKSEDIALRSVSLLLGLSEAGYERIKGKHIPHSTSIH